MIDEIREKLKQFNDDLEYEAEHICELYNMGDLDIQETRVKLKEWEVLYAKIKPQAEALRVCLDALEKYGDKEGWHAAFVEYGGYHPVTVFKTKLVEWPEGANPMRNQDGYEEAQQAIQKVAKIFGIEVRDD